MGDAYAAGANFIRHFRAGGALLWSMLTEFIRAARRSLLVSAEPAQCK